MLTRITFVTSGYTVGQRAAVGRGSDRSVLLARRLVGGAPTHLL